MIVASIREEAQEIIRNLPDEASRDDVMYGIYVRKKIDAGIEAADTERLVPHDQVKKRICLLPIPCLHDDTV